MEVYGGAAPRRRGEAERGSRRGRAVAPGPESYEGGGRRRSSRVSEVRGDLAARQSRRGERDREGWRHLEVSGMEREDDVNSSCGKRRRSGERGGGDREAGWPERCRRGGERSRERWRFPGKSRRWRGTGGWGEAGVAGDGVLLPCRWAGRGAAAWSGRVPARSFGGGGEFVGGRPRAGGSVEGRVEGGAGVSAADRAGSDGLEIRCSIWSMRSRMSLKAGLCR